MRTIKSLPGAAVTLRQCAPAAGSRLHHRGVTPLGAVLRGLLAGAAGTAAMDVAQYLQYRKGGGEQHFGTWEFAAVESFEGAPAPAQVGKRVVEGLLQTKLPETTAGTVNNVMHWGYGIGWGLPLGILAGSLRRPKLRHGPLFGTAVWLASYALLPPTGLYQPIWEYPPKTLGKDWASHLVYGTTAGAALRVLLLDRSPG